MLCAALVTNHLLAQCNKCDSLVRAMGYHINTEEEKRNDPGLSARSSTYRCGPNCTVIIEPPPRPDFQFDGKWGYVSVRAGTNFGHLKTHGYKLEEYEYTSKPQPYFSLAFDLDAPEWDGFCIRAELGWQSYQYSGVRQSGERLYNRREIKARGIGEEVLLFYKYPKGNFRWFAGIGAGHEILKFKVNKLYDYYYSEAKPSIVNDTESMKKPHYFLPMVIGVMLKDRIEFRYKFQYSKWNSGEEGDDLYNVKNISSIFTVGYRFL